MPKLIQTINHLHPATFNAGPRLYKTEIWEFNGTVHKVEFWYENGRLAYVK